MFSFVNRTVFDIPLTWNRPHFEATRSKYRKARKLIEISLNVQLEKQLRNVYHENVDIEKKIIETNEQLINHEKKVHVFDKLTEVASQSLPDYFDKRMENVRSIVQEHCNAIQLIIREENEHWNEIHSVIDQNIITSNDIHPCTNNEPIVQNIQTIDEENNPFELVNNNNTTSLLTQMNRKFRSHSKRLSTAPSTSIEVDLPLPIENFLPNKQERVSVALRSIKSRRFLPPIDTTYVIKLEETTNTEMNESSPITRIPTENSLTTVTASPMYSQPNPPAQLYFSPTILQDEESESIQNILSPLDQNQLILQKPKVIIHRFSQTFLLENFNTEEINKTHNIKRPKINDERPFMIDSIPSRQPCQSNDVNQHSFAVPAPVSKPRTRSTIKNESKSITIDTIKPSSRKRKQSVSEDNDIKSNSIALRKRKSVSIINIDEKQPKKKVTKKRKNKKIKEDEIPIREPSPLPIIDRSKHYSTRFSTRSHRMNNFTLSMMNSESDEEENNQSKLPSRLRTKTSTRNQNDNQTIVSKSKKKTKRR